MSSMVKEGSWLLLPSLLDGPLSRVSSASVDCRLSMFQPPFVQPDLSSSQAAETITASFLGRIVQIVISDRRWFEGAFICVDSGMNVILQGAQQFRHEEGPASIVQKQWVGMIMIPGKHIENVAIKETNAEAQQSSSQPILPPPTRQFDDANVPLDSMYN